LPGEAEKTEKAPEKGGIQKKLVRAREGFAAIQPTELSLKLGDIVTLLYDTNAKTYDVNGWCQGELKGKVGWFPIAYVEEL